MNTPALLLRHLIPPRPRTAHAAALPDLPNFATKLRKAGDCFGSMEEVATRPASGSLLTVREPIDDTLALASANYCRQHAGWFFCYSRSSLGGETPSAGAVPARKSSI